MLSSFSFSQQRDYSTLVHRHKLLAASKPATVLLLSRNIGSITRLARMVLKIRYLILGGAVGVGVTVAEVSVFYIVTGWGIILGLKGSA